MANRFEDAPTSVEELVNRVISKDFDRLSGARIKIIFDTKKRSSGGKYVLGRMKKTNEHERFLTALETNTEDGYDYFMYLDKNVFEKIDEKDKIRLIRHELQHCELDFNADNPYKIKDHEITDFYDEIEYNRDDPRWGERLASIAESVYSSEND
jgi:predicted metallopeptidase